MEKLIKVLGITCIVSLVLMLSVFTAGCIYETHYGTGSIKNDALWMYDIMNILMFLVVLSGLGWFISFAKIENS